MVVCPNNWSGRDEYEYYDDCHVWMPLYTIVNVINLLHAMFNLVYSIKKLAQAGGFLPKVILTGSVLSTFTFGIRLAFQWTLGDRNLLLNAFYGIGYAFYWVAVIRFVFNYLHAVFLTERLRGKTEAYLPQAEKCFHFSMIFSFVSEIGVTCLPCFIPAFVLFPTYLIFNYVRAVILTVIFVYFGLIIRKMLNEMEVSQTYYQKLRRKLDLVMVPWVIAVTIGLILGILASTVPVMTRNQYVLNIFTVTSFQTICALILSSITRAHHSHPAANTTKSENKSSHSSPGSSVHSTPDMHSTSRVVFIPYRPSRTNSPPHTPVPAHTPLHRHHHILGNQDPCRTPIFTAHSSRSSLGGDGLDPSVEMVVALDSKSSIIQLPPTAEPELILNLRPSQQEIGGEQTNDLNNTFGSSSMDLTSSPHNLLLLHKSGHTTSRDFGEEGMLMERSSHPLLTSPSSPSPLSGLRDESAFSNDCTPEKYGEPMDNTGEIPALLREEQMLTPVTLTPAESVEDFKEQEQEKEEEERQEQTTQDSAVNPSPLGD